MNHKTITTELVSIINRAVAAVLLLTAACCVEERAAAALPFITGQPYDIFAEKDEKAMFRVEVIGEKLSYQWNFIGGGETGESAPIPGATQAEYEVPRGDARKYGLYFCTIESQTDEGSQETQTRFATLSGPAHPGGASGVFMPVQYSVPTSGTQDLICGNPYVKKVAFLGWNTNNPTDVGFRGNVWKVVGSTTNVVDNDHYTLQWAHNSLEVNKGCCTKLVGSTEEEVVATLVPDRRYKFTAFFRPGLAPPSGTIVILKGTWTQ